MNLYKKNIKLLFLAALSLSLFMPVFFPAFRIHYFIPFIIVLFYRKPFIACLWGALACGVILDLLSPHGRIGLYAINYTVASAILYQQKRNFFADSLTTLPIMTFFFSVLSTLIQIILINVFEKTMSVSLSWFFKDLLFLPFVDTLFAFCVYILPFALFGKPVRKGKDYFMQKEDA
jgi:rod shape-determining protein MreD